MIRYISWTRKCWLTVWVSLGSERGWWVSCWELIWPEWKQSMGKSEVREQGRPGHCSLQNEQKLRPDLGLPRLWIWGAGNHNNLISWLISGWCSPLASHQFLLIILLWGLQICHFYTVPLSFTPLTNTFHAFPEMSVITCFTAFSFFLLDPPPTACWCLAVAPYLTSCKIAFREK